MLLAGCAGSTPGSPGAEGGEPTGPPSAEPLALECGLSVVDGGQEVVRYCGAGAARVTVPGGSYDAEGAECRQRGEFVTANFGTNYSNDEAAQGQYVGLLLGGVPGAGASPAKVRLAGLEVTVGGKRQQVAAATATARLTGDRLEGTVSGRVGEDAVSIEFHCTTA
ncbi:hypothetical protein N864_03295 [Intrasporangium chromatireducens Q5-1]|uniref:Lipoprotein n=1 Tax=Intrasporangium chromatireducens Q5-1 TaxID=584657 RepID=W9GS67_9MICO|nr:hypothetical protein N864_03295 [Intrasporangium chromatireducens Q5-1]